MSRSHLIAFRLTDVEYDLVTSMAQKAGLSASAYIQIARYFHMGGIRSKAMQDEIHECISQIFDMRKEIAKMAGDHHGSVETYCKQKR